MNTDSSRPLAAVKPWLLLILTIALAGGFWMLGQIKLSELGRKLTEARARQSALEERFAEKESELHALLTTIRKTDSERKRLLAEAFIIEDRSEASDPEARWVSPPTSWPSWPSDSPYVWLEKSFWADLHPPIFSESGKLRLDAAEILDLDHEQKRTLDEALNAVLNDYWDLEITHAERLAETLPGITTDGPYVTLSIPAFPDEAQRLRQRFSELLNQHLGDQRAELVSAAAQGWMREHFNTRDQKPVIYSVVRHSHGTFSISIQRSIGSSSIGGTRELDRYIPRHLLPAFDELRFPSSSEAYTHGSP